MLMCKYVYGYVHVRGTVYMRACAHQKHSKLAALCAGCVLARVLLVLKLLLLCVTAMFSRRIWSRKQPRNL